MRYVSFQACKTFGDFIQKQTLLLNRSVLKWSWRYLGWMKVEQISPANPTDLKHQVWFQNHLTQSLNRQSFRIPTCTSFLHDFFHDVFEYAPFDNYVLHIYIICINIIYTFSVQKQHVIYFEKQQPPTTNNNTFVFTFPQNPIETAHPKRRCFSMWSTLSLQGWSLAKGTTMVELILWKYQKGHHFL